MTLHCGNPVQFPLFSVNMEIVKDLGKFEIIYKISEHFTVISQLAP